MGDTRVADDTGPRLAGAVVVVPCASQILAAHAAKIDEAEAEHGDGTWCVGVEAQQIAHADGGYVCRRRKSWSSKVCALTGKADLVVRVCWIAHNKLDAAPITVGELFGQVVRDDGVIRQVVHRDGGRIEAPISSVS